MSLRQLVLVLLTVSLAETATAQMEGITVTMLQRTSVSGQPGLESVTIMAEFAPGASTGFHVHPGDEYAVVLEGVLDLDRLVSSEEGASDSRKAEKSTAYHNERDMVHNTVNRSGEVAVITATFIIEAGQPISIPWGNGN